MQGGINCFPVPLFSPFSPIDRRSNEAHLASILAPHLAKCAHSVYSPCVFSLCCTLTCKLVLLLDGYMHSHTQCKSTYQCTAYLSLSFFLSFFLSLSLSLSFSLIVAIPGYHWHCHCSCTSSTSSSLSSGSKVHYILVSLASCSGLLLEKVPLYQLKVDAVEVSH